MPELRWEHKLGKNRLLLQAYANGLDRSPVMPTVVEMTIKSIGSAIAYTFMETAKANRLNVQDYHLRELTLFVFGGLLNGYYPIPSSRPRSLTLLF